MSGIELVQNLEKIKDEKLSSKERLSAVARLSRFDPNILSPNVEPLIGVLRVLAERVLAGKRSEIEIFGAYLVQLCKISTMIPKQIDRIVTSLEKLFEKNKALLDIDYVFVALLVGSRYLIESEPAIIFDEFIRDVIVKGLHVTSVRIRLRALTTLFTGLWIIPWALNFYFEVIKELLEGKDRTLWVKTLEYLGILGKRNFYALRSIIDHMLSKYSSIEAMPREVIFFLADMQIPIREEDYIERISNYLKKAILSISDPEVQSRAIIGLATIFKHPKFVEEKENLLSLMWKVLSEPTFQKVLAVAYALAIPQWYKVHVDDKILRKLLQYYPQIPDSRSKKLFLDTLLLVYSNLEELSRIILEFLTGRITEVVNDMGLASSLFEVISSIVKSEVRKDNIRFLLKNIIDLLHRPVSEFSIAMRTIIIENILLPIASIAPDVFIEFAEDLKKAYEKARSYTIHDSLSRAIYEALRKYNQVNEKALMLMDIMFDTPNLEAFYDTLLEYLVGLAKKYSIGILKHINVLINTYKIIRKLASQITNPRERYFVIDKALKNLVRVIGLILPVAPKSLAPYVVKLLVAIFAGESGTAVMDALYVMKQSKDNPQVFSIIIDEVKAMSLPEEKLKLLESEGIL